MEKINYVERPNHVTGEIVKSRYASCSYPAPRDAEDYTNHVSSTKPDMTMSLREIIFKHTNGQSVATDNGLVFTNSYAHNLKKMDLVELRSLADKQKEYIASISREIAAKSEERKKAAAEKKLREDEILKYMEEQKKNSELPK